MFGIQRFETLPVVGGWGVFRVQWTAFCSRTHVRGRSTLATACPCPHGHSGIGSPCCHTPAPARARGTTATAGCYPGLGGARPSGQIHSGDCCTRVRVAFRCEDVEKAHFRFRFPGELDVPPVQKRKAHPPQRHDVAELWGWHAAGHITSLYVC